MTAKFFIRNNALWVEADGDLSPLSEAKANLQDLRDWYAKSNYVTQVPWDKVIENTVRREVQRPMVIDGNYVEGVRRIC
jgi:hypothetical protein